jgi:hypothetical protein
MKKKNQSEALIFSSLGTFRSFRYFIVLSRRVLDLDIKTQGHLETSLM